MSNDVLDITDEEWQKELEEIKASQQAAADLLYNLEYQDTHCNYGDDNP